MISEESLSYDQWSITWSNPVGRGCPCTEANISHWHARLIALVAVLLENAKAGGLQTVGVEFILTTRDVVNLILATLSLNFIADIDNIQGHEPATMLSSLFWWCNCCDPFFVRRVASQQAFTNEEVPGELEGSVFSRSAWTQEVPGELEGSVFFSITRTQC